MWLLAVCPVGLSLRTFNCYDHSITSKRRTASGSPAHFDFVTGLIDAVSFFRLDHVFVANMTGNVVFLAFAIADAREISIAASSIALIAFFAGALAGGRLGSSYGAHRWQHLTLIGHQRVRLGRGGNRDSRLSLRRLCLDALRRDRSARARYGAAKRNRTTAGSARSYNHSSDPDADRSRRGFAVGRRQQSTTADANCGSRNYVLGCTRGRNARAAV